MFLTQEIQAGICSAIQSIYQIAVKPSIIQTEYTNPDHEGDITAILFPLFKLKIGNPQEIGKQIGDYLLENTKWLESYQVIKGFLNLKIKSQVWIEFLRNYEPILVDQKYEGKKIMVEFASPNTNKPLHLGHLRNIFLGDAICRIYENIGFQVIKACLVNDRGIHICKSMYAWKHLANGETPQSAQMKGDHFVGKYYVEFEKLFQAEYAEWQKSDEGKQVFSKAKEKNSALDEKTFFKEFKDQYFNQYSRIGSETKNMLFLWEKQDPEILTLWKTMNQWVYEGFEETYQKIGISFDKMYYESDTYLLGKQWIEKGLEQKVFYQKADGSVWIDLTDEGLDHKLVLRSDGTSVYITQDIGTAYLKYQDYQMDRSIYVIGNEQDYHMKVLITIAKRLHIPNADGMFHLSYGMVELPSGKMKSREGTVVDADDLIEEMIQTAKEMTEELGKTEGLEHSELQNLYETIGLGALKYFLLKTDSSKKILFDPQESISFTGNTAPFIQYTYARIHSLLKKSHHQELQRTVEIQEMSKVENELCRMLSKYPSVLFNAAMQYNPTILAGYLFELAQIYGSFYQTTKILTAENQKVGFQLLLSARVAKTLKKGLSLLGITVPEKM